MPSPEKRTIRRLVELSRALARVAGPEEILPLLAEAAVEHLEVDGAAVLRIDASGALVLAASQGVPEGVKFVDDPDLVGDEVGQAVIKSMGGSFASEQTFPLVSGGGVFGYLVVLSKDRKSVLSDETMIVAEGLVAMSASALSHAAELGELSRSYAELRASREVLARSQKLRALGEMAAGVAHDLKNIINPLSLHLQFLRRAVPRGNDDVQQSLVEMQGVLKRGLETIERLRDFSRQSTTARVELADLDRIAHEALEIAKPRLRARHDVHFKIVQQLGAPPRVTLSTAEAVAAIVNLLVNAADAMNNGGTITVASGAEDGGSWLRVADDGPGMSPEVEQRVFEPFFTTKGDEGTGLGLAMVYAFVQRHGGRLKLDTAPQNGAAFTLWFPAAAR